MQNVPDISESVRCKEIKQYPSNDLHEMQHNSFETFIDTINRFRVISAILEFLFLLETHSV